MLTEEIKKAIEEIGKDLGVEMIVHECVTVGAKKEINGETYGDYVLLTEDMINGKPGAGYWDWELKRLKKNLKECFEDAGGQ